MSPQYNFYYMKITLLNWLMNVYSMPLVDINLLESSTWLCSFNILPSHTGRTNDFECVVYTRAPQIPSNPGCWAPQSVSDPLDPGASKESISKALAYDARKQAAEAGMAPVLNPLPKLAKGGTGRLYKKKTMEQSSGLSVT